MMRLIREFRLIPVVLFAIVCLLALKVLGIVLDGGYTLADLDFSSNGGAVVADPTGVTTSGRSADATTIPGPVPRGKKSWAQEIFNFPDVTGSTMAEIQAEKNAEKRGPNFTNPDDPQSGGNAAANPLNANRSLSAGERAILERLQERRQELEARARELEIRENLLKAVEKQLEARSSELKDLDARIKSSMAQKDEAEAARFKGLVTMYENMKAKDAAKIFDRLELKLLVDVVSQINPRRMSDIMAQMLPETAEKLTVELASRANGAEKGQPTSDLPKIEGRPPGQ